MSCQQTTRLTEDPYAFTEPPLLTVLLPATPNSHKTSTIYSNKSQQQHQFVDQKNQNNQFIQPRKIFNGVLHTYNGICKQINSQATVNVAKKHIVQQKDVCVKSLPISNEPSVIKTIIEGSFNNSNFSTIQPPLPPQSSQKSNRSISSSPKHKLVENNINNNHSNSTTTSAASLSVNRQKSTKLHNVLSSPSLTTSSSLSSQQLPLKTPPTLSSTQLQTTKQQQQQQKYQHLITKDTFISGNTPTNTTKKIDGCELKSNYLFDDNRNDNTFLVPKVESRSYSSSSHKKNVGNKETLAKKNRRRTYSSSPHHETLQRISNKNLLKLSAPPPPAKILKTTPTIPKVWHAPDSYVYDYSSTGNGGAEQLGLSSCINNTWFTDLDVTSPASESAINSLSSFASLSTTALTREQRIMMKKSSLRRQAVQYWRAVISRERTASKKRLISVVSSLKKFENYYKSPPQSTCSIANCNNASLELTAFCFQHIVKNAEQKLFYPCTAKFLDNSQCRIPVFDISHESPLCREHGWKRDNYDKMIQEQKPKKPPRKKTKPSAMTRPPKRNKKKKKLQMKQMEKSSASSSPPTHYTNVLNNHHSHNNHHLNQHHQNNQHEDHNNHNHNHVNQNNHIINSHNNHITNHIIHRDIDIIGKTGSNQHLYDAMENLVSLDTILNESPQHHLQHELHHYNNKNYIRGTTTQDMLGENSSAYESSEDTGVGGLSESELIGAHDVIEEIPFEMETHERLLEENDIITNVLNHIPTEALNELFSVQQNGTYEPSQEEEEDLARALEAVDEHVKSLEQMTGDPTSFLGDFLDVDDEMLEGTDICDDSILQSPNPNHQNSNEIRGLVHT